MVAVGMPFRKCTEWPEDQWFCHSARLPLARNEKKKSPTTVLGFKSSSSTTNQIEMDISLNNHLALPGTASFSKE